MHDDVDQIRGPSLVISGVFPPPISEINSNEFGGATLIELGILSVPHVTADPAALRATTAPAVRIEPLIAAKNIQCIRRLMIQKEIARLGAGICCTTSMATELGADFIDATTLFCRKIAAGPASRNGLGRKRAWYDSYPLQLGVSFSRLLRIGLIRTDQAFNGAVSTRAGLPIRVYLPDLLGQLSRFCFRQHQARSLSGRRLDLLSIYNDPAETACYPPVLRVLSARNCIVLWICVRQHPRVVLLRWFFRRAALITASTVARFARPLPTLPYARRHARLVRPIFSLELSLERLELRALLDVATRIWPEETMRVVALPARERVRRGERMDWRHAMIVSL
jgi:hypothetical protein